MTPARKDPFLVLDRLEVGAVRLEPRRLRATYTATAGKQSATTDLVYRWEEDVFDPNDAHDVGLATMIAAQPALNYGLFARELAFRGPLDRTDQRFLADAIENTAREIYVNKLHVDNPFFVAGLAKGVPEVQERYNRAELVFDDTPEIAAPRPWSDDPSQHAVLSSGGKDSLLSFGLLKETGHRAHPIFVNESGRHWYTALNAYREFSQHVPETTRVWTNSDRVFAWMLRQLPFVRPDFERIRADIYAIRLWTVAVFLFGALPVMKRRGVGRLVIGDEFDTSTRERTHGIPHYGGLYDQSRWFDASLTRYFHRKRWDVDQFSILRPLSELLIQQILVERYPDLQRDQMSCHATHIEGERVMPCGKCEKCRRIVGMLVALDKDPKACGYNEAQIASCLAELRDKPIKQESAGAAELIAMLAEKGAFPAPAAPGSKSTAAGSSATGSSAAGSPAAGSTTEPSGSPPSTRRHPEIHQIRVDSRRAAIEDIPTDLRAPLFEIWLKHARGSVRRQGRTWVASDLLADATAAGPFAFERGSATAPVSSDGTPAARPGTKRVHILGELTWPEARDRFLEVDTALLPVGALEQHGLHSPLDTDSFDANYLCERVADRCSTPKPLVLPLIPYGVSYHHEDFAGTISVQNDTLARFVYEVGMGAARNGIAKLVIVNGHGGNMATLQFAAQMINRDAHIFTCVDSGETSDADIGQIASTPGDVHAGEIETSTTMAVRPHLVDMKLARKSVPRFSSQYLDFSGHQSVEWYARTKKISESGVLGDATKANAEKGARIWEVSIRNLVEFVEDLKRLSLDEIHERRY